MARGSLMLGWLRSSFWPSLRAGASAQVDIVAVSEQMFSAARHDKNATICIDCYA